MEIQTATPHVHQLLAVDFLRQPTTRKDQPVVRKILYLLFD